MSKRWRIGALWISLCITWLLAATLLHGRDNDTLRQEYHITCWQTDDGLPENSATAIAQTPDGYLWFGTFHGLTRFDGVHFKVLDPSNTPGLPDLGIVNLHLAKSGRLWVSTYRGLVSYFHGKWTAYGSGTQWTDLYVRTFAENADGVLFATSFQGPVCRLEPDRIVELPSLPTAKGGCRGDVDPNGTLWAIRDDFFGSFDGRAWVRSPISSTLNAGFVAAGSARDGGLWVISDSNLYKILSGRIVTKIGLDAPLLDIWSLYEDEDGTIWGAAYQHGLYRFSAGGHVEQFTQADGLSYDSLRFVFRDLEHNLWVGSSGGGLMRFRARTFRTFGTEERLRVRVTRSIAEESPDHMMIATYGGGLVRLDLTKPGNSLTPLIDAGRYAQSVLYDRDGRLWSGFFGSDASTWDDGVERTLGLEAPRPGDTAAMFQDSKGRIWLGGRAGVGVVKPGQGAAPRLSSVLPLRGVRCFAEQPSDGRIWAAAAGSLYRLGDDGEFRAYPARGRSPVRGVICLRIGEDGRVWAGTETEGIWSLETNRWSNITSRHGLVSDTVASILDDGLGYFWIGSNRGIQRLAKADCIAVADGRQPGISGPIFTVEEGLGGVECSSDFQPNACQDSRGRLWFATQKGVAVVAPKTFRLETNAPLLHFESVSYVDTRNLRRTIPLEEHGLVELPPGSSQFEIRYAAPSFSNPARLRFKQRWSRGERLLDESETDERSAKTTFLAPGTYTFEIRVANHHGVWGRQAEALQFVIQPYFWQTWLFRTLVALCVVGGVGAGVWRFQSARLRDEQERSAQHRALAEGRARLASVMEGTSDLVAFTSPEGKVLYLNPAGRRMAGYGDGEDVSSLTLADYCSASSLEAIRNVGIPTALMQGTWSGESVLRRRDGVEIPVSQVIISHKDPDGRATFFSSIVRDISERKQLESQLRQAQKMEAIGTLAGGIAHDFNNILGAIIGNVDLAKMDVKTGHPARESLDEIGKASLRAKGLVQQILAFSRKQQVTRQPILLANEVREAAGLMRAAIPAAVELHVECAADVPVVLADPTQLHQALMNLCTNAWHALEGRPGRIAIQVSAHQVDPSFSKLHPDLLPGRYARITVTDNGKGMDAATMERIFEPFFTTKAVGRGTGLGLSAVHGIARSHGGAVLVSSRPGVGSTFELFLPAAPDSPAVAAGPARSHREEPMAGKGERVYYLDDEEALVLLATRMLERLGYRVTGFTRAAEALAALKTDTGPIALVVTDFNMPHMSGLQFASEVRALRPGLALVLASGHVTEELRAEALAVGIQAVIYKPNLVDEICRTLRHLGGGGERVLPELESPTGNPLARANRQS